MRDGNTLEESIQVCRWLEEAGVDGFHVSTGGAFPHPRNPAGKLPLAELVPRPTTAWSRAAGTRSATTSLFRMPPLNAGHADGGGSGRSDGRLEGITLPDAQAVKRAVGVPVLCAGGFQTASVIARAIESGDCDGVTIARPLLANPTLPQLFARGSRPARRDRARTATSASSTSSRTRSGATTRAASSRARR